MSDSSMPPLPQDSSLDRISSLPVGKDQVSPVEAIALSDKTYSQRFRDLLGHRTREYLKQDLAYSALGSLICGLVAFIAGEVTVSVVFGGVLGFLSIFVANVIKHALRTPGEIDTVIRERLSQKEKLLEAKLTIVFGRGEPFIDLFTGVNGEPDHSLLTYRVRVTSSVPGWVRLTAEEVYLEGRNLPDVWLRPTNKSETTNQTELHANVSHMWDVIQKSSKESELMLAHAMGANYPRRLGRKAQFRIIASNLSALVTTSKFITAKLDDSDNVYFQLDDDQGDHRESCN